MTYASYFGSPPELLPTSAMTGSSPQSFMMYDIAALQALYGANFSKAGTVANYTWDKTYRPGIDQRQAGAAAHGDDVDRQDLLLAPTAQTATVSKDGDSSPSERELLRRHFMIAGRGSGADAPTTVSFVQFLPDLSRHPGRQPNHVGRHPTGWNRRRSHPAGPRL